jgi:hypothetical protein
MNAKSPPGWYPDNSGSGRRYWNGYAWTEHTADGGDEPTPERVVRPASKPLSGGAGASQGNWFLRHKVMSGVLAFVVLIFIGGVIGSAADEPAPPTAGTSTEATGDPDAEVAPVSEPAPEPVDTDGDGVSDEDDFRPEDPEIQTADDVDTDRDGTRDGDDLRPKDPKVQTEDDIDTDRDGTPDYKDDFPRNPEYSKDTDGDGVADAIDDFPRDERYSQDSDGDGVADTEDVFPADPSRSEITPAMENAMDAADSYLDYSAFSRSGLIEQLEYEGYKTEDATFAVDYLKVNWNKQAFKSAKSYLDYSSFSLSGLIGQLQYEGFTYEQASFGANKAY